MSNNIWGERLKKALDETKLSQTQLAVRLGVPASKISDAIAGRVSLTASAKLQLMDLLGFVVTRNSLLSLVGEVWPKAAENWAERHNQMLAESANKKNTWKVGLLKARDEGLTREEVLRAINEIW